MNPLWYMTIRAIANAFSGAAEHKGVATVKGLLAQNGWKDVKPVQDTGLLVPFGSHNVLITCGDNLAVVTVVSGADFHNGTVPEAVCGYLLARNKDSVYAAWRLTDLGGKVGFAATCPVHLNGFAPATLQEVVESVLTEAREVDRILKARGVF